MVCPTFGVVLETSIKSESVPFSKGLPSRLAHVPSNIRPVESANSLTSVAIGIVLLNLL